jgi:hypothetical protein
MPILTDLAEENLKDKNFIKEFNEHETQYLDIVKIISESAKFSLQTANITIPSSAEEFAEKFLLPSVSSTLISDKFPYFRQALSRRPYIDAWEQIVWSKLLARYVLNEAIKRGDL